MLPVALNASLEAQRETRAAFIARGIFSDVANEIISFSDDGKGPSLSFDDAGRKKGETGASEATFEARVERIELDPANFDFAVTQMPCVRVIVSTPVTVNFDNRSRYIFVQTVREEP